VRYWAPPLARAVVAAQEVLALRGIDSPEETDLFALADDHRIKVRRETIGNAEGRLVRSGRRGVMTIDRLAFASEKFAYSERGVVRWCTAKRGFGVTVQKDARVPRDLATGRTRAVGAEAWGRARGGVGGVERLFEAAVDLAPFDAVVTMLWHEPEAGVGASSTA
jgi:hypothetical protein